MRENPRAIGKNMNEVILSINDHKYLPNYISLHIFFTSSPTMNGLNKKNIKLFIYNSQIPEAYIYIIILI